VRGSRFAVRGSRFAERPTIGRHGTFLDLTNLLATRGNELAERYRNYCEHTCCHALRIVRTIVSSGIQNYRDLDAWQVAM
jgi:hypothetical protein